MTLSTILTAGIWLGAIIVLWFGIAYCWLRRSMPIRAVNVYGLTHIGLACGLALVPLVLTHRSTAILPLTILISLLIVVLLWIKQIHQVAAHVAQLGITTKQLLLLRGGTQREQ